MGESDKSLDYLLNANYFFEYIDDILRIYGEDRYVAIFDTNMVDSDNDRTDLLNRVRLRFKRDSDNVFISNYSSFRRENKKYKIRL